ncbi:MAG: endonuclease III, partial [Arcanobacterium sp.]|nr:endonuclease III [Arcanobacterium sp.]
MAKTKLPKRPRSLKARQEAAQEITERLAKLYPDAKCALVHQNAFELLVATVLSAQTTDERVNSVTPTLFGKYPDPFAMAAASLSELEQILHPLGFYRAKAKSVLALSEALI